MTIDTRPKASREKKQHSIEKNQREKMCETTLMLS